MLKNNTEPKAVHADSQGFNYYAIALIVFLLIIAAMLYFYLNKKSAIIDYGPTPSFANSPTIIPTIIPKTDSPLISEPIANSTVQSPVKIKGTAPPGWMFEGVFLVKLLDLERNIIIQGQAKELTPGSWQSGNLVEFEADLSFSTTSKSGFLVLENDNPSGNPENSKSFEIPIQFK
jgi:hypothetical protein